MLITKTKGISFTLFFLLTICVSLSQKNSKLAILVAANLHQSRTLAILRDTLLPKR